MNTNALGTIAVMLAVTAPLSLAKIKHAPLPERMLAAKLVYIENHGPAEVADRAYDELKQWKRFEIVSDRSKADLILTFSVDEGRSSSGRTAVYDPTPAPGMGGAGSWKYGTVHSSSSSTVHLELADPHTGDVLYSDTSPTGFKSATRSLIKELRKRIEEQETESNRK